MCEKRKRLSLKDKLKILEESEKGLSGRKLAELFQISKSYACDIIKNKDKLKKRENECEFEESKRKFPKTEGYLIDQTVFNWFRKASNKHLSLSGPLIKEKALEAANTLHIDNFKASNGWLDKFILRHNIKLKALASETADVHSASVENWKIKLSSITNGYSARDIFNAEETGLYFRATPAAKTFALKNDKCPGRNKVEERLTILFCVSMEGEKMEPLVIGKTKNPRCLKGMDNLSLPLQWVSNENAWMTSEIMKTWLDRFNNKMHQQERNVLLFLDNSTSHPKLELSNVKITFLPPNTAPHCQPLDQGIIRNFKTLYRSFLMRRLLTYVDASTDFKDFAKEVTIANALIWISDSWKQVNPETIKKCFRKAGFGNGTDNYDEDGDSILLSQLIESNYLNLDEYNKIDANLETESSEFSIKDCIDEVIESEANVDSDSESNDKVENLTCNIRNLKEACEKLKEIEGFLWREDGCGEAALQVSYALTKCEAIAYSKKA